MATKKKKDDEFEEAEGVEVTSTSEAVPDVETEPAEAAVEPEVEVVAEPAVVPPEETTPLQEAVTPSEAVTLPEREAPESAPEGESEGVLAEPYFLDPPAREAAKPQPPEQAVHSGPRRLSDQNLRELDRYLTPEEQTEWNAIYASYRSRSVLSGVVVGVDQNTFDVHNQETGLLETQTMLSVVIVNYRVKVIIPEQELWMPEDAWPGYVIRGMVGTKLEYVILEVDRESGVAVASRRMAMRTRRCYFKNARNGHQEGEPLSCTVLSVGPGRCLVECNGYDKSLTPRQLTYTSVSDLRERYFPGQELRCILTKYAPEEDDIAISVKLATTNPFDGAEQRHPVGCRRKAVISGKYYGGVFVTLPDELSVLCNYSRLLRDEDFQIGDKVIISIDPYNFERKLIAGRILSKLW